MADEARKVKITVIQRTVNRELVEQYLDVDESYGACDLFADGQEFVIERPWQMPEGFCAWAWADIRSEIMTIYSGGDLPWIKQRGTAIAGCTDFFRPVLFRIARGD
jgi:uncharacterized repeat protein (TIGR04076 family)